MGDKSGGFFKGKERLEIFAPLGRAIRKGSPQELATSDYDLIRKVIQNNDPASKTYLEISYSNSAAMVMVYLEWLLAWRATLAKYPAELDEKWVVEECFQRWKSLTQSDSEFHTKVTTLLSYQHLDPMSYDASTVDGYRAEMAKGLPAFASKFLGETTNTYQNLVKSLDSKDSVRSLGLFDLFFLESKLIHDLLVELVSLYPIVIQEKFKQEWADRILRQSFSECLFYQMMWQVAGALTPEELAAYLGEHLRAHFSGVDRTGAVKVVEEKDRYRLIFEPCGSGGAMRRRALEKRGKPTGVLSDGSPQTWGLKGKVPGYCSHCAVSELESVKRMGYPVFVTEFQADPAKPCGWTFYKDPNLIPEKYFERLGLKKDPKLFKRPGRSES
jgi:hypothetical protein